MLKVKYLDHISICLIKMVIPYASIQKYLEHIINNSLQKGDFPNNMKIMRVIPILKKYDAQ